MTRIGKIARLPAELREELNRRLRNGEPGRQLLTWLNGHPETQRVLAASFGGRAITEGNLSDWKNGGYMDWLAGEELLAKARGLSATASELAGLTPERITEHLATILAARFAELLADLSDATAVEFRRRLRALQPLCENIVALRRGDHSGIRLTLAREQLQARAGESPKLMSAEEKAEVYRQIFGLAEVGEKETSGKSG